MTTTQHTFNLDPEIKPNPSRLDKYLTEQLDDTWTRSMVRSAIDDKLVTVNGRVVKAGQKLQPGDVVHIIVQTKQELSLTPQDIPLDILYEDDDIAVINKPAGMVVHPSPGHPNGTLVNALLHRFGSLPEGDDPIRPGIVHRIDKDTSGSLVIAKTDEAMTYLKDLFKTHTIDRIYHAIVLAQGLDDHGTIETLHGRSTSNRKLYSSTVTEGRKAITHYKILEIYEQDVKLVACKLETGRTHQIRVHFYDRQNPLLGDKTYGGRKTSTTSIIGRQALHAFRLGLVTPSGKSICIDAPYPEDFELALEKLRAGKDWRTP